MPVWPGGPCPDCGQEMPAKLVHCQFCRCLLNPDLYRSDVEIPNFFELEEISSVIDVEARGYFILCPHCEEELRISRKYAGADVACKQCRGQFRLDVASPRIRIKALYSACPYCQKELRIASKYLGQKVACKFCDGHVHVRQSAMRAS